MKGTTQRAFAAVVLSLMVAGCSDGLHAEVEKERAVNDAVQGQVGDIRITDAYLVTPTGTTAPQGSSLDFYVYIYNGGNQADTLTDITSDAGTISMVGSQSSSSPSSARSSARPSSSAVGGGASAGPAPSGSAATFSLQPLTAMNLESPDGPHLQLTGLSKDITPTDFVTVTFDFANAGSLQLRVPVEIAPGGASPTSSPSPQPLPSTESPTPLSGATPSTTPTAHP